ncbi:MAG: sulfotransferase [Ignavibacteriae bacterium]|nr:sulfotransferase [Ignavibacteriota bacterium]
MDSLLGITFYKWFELLKKNRFNISFKNIIFVLGLTILSTRTAYYCKKEKNITKNIKKLKEDPIFILGHWRSGTTFLHNLMIQDKNFIFPKIFEVIYPATFLRVREKFVDIIKKQKITNRPMDNVKNDPMLPGEEEFAMAALTLKSPLVGWAFPNNFDYYERYLTFDEVDKAEVKEWEKEYDHYLRKISINSDKQLILKSPVNTARIKYLLKLYPNAKFINIHRNPINVFTSTKKLHNTAIKMSNLQKRKNYDIDSRIISTYKKVYESYFNSINLIPKNNFVEISFEEFEKNPLDVINEIYSKLSIPNFESIRSNLVAYIDTLKDYQKNKFDNLDDELKQKLIIEWGNYYKKWGYTIE